MPLSSYLLSTIVTRLAQHLAEAASRAPAGSEPATSRAAVAAILREGEADGDAEILFIRRAERSGDPWSGHMAFPGGRRDPGDATLFDTAIRETREEVGLDLAAHGTLLLSLPEVGTMGRRVVGMTVAPFVFSVPREASSLRPNDEVAETIWAPVGPIARGETASTFDYEYGGNKYQYPSLMLGDRVVWGLTHRILQMLLEILNHPR